MLQTPTERLWLQVLALSCSIFNCVQYLMHKCTIFNSHKNAYTNKSICVHSNTCKHVGIFAFMNMYNFTYTHTHTHTRTHIIHSYAQKNNHTYAHTYIHTNLHTCLHTYTHTYIHAYIHTYIHTYILRHTMIPTYTLKYVIPFQIVP